jgi:hypothetical protein
MTPIMGRMTGKSSSVSGAKETFRIRLVLINVWMVSRSYLPRWPRLTTVLRAVLGYSNVRLMVMVALFLGFGYRYVEILVLCSKRVQFRGVSWGDQIPGSIGVNSDDV